MNLRLIFLIFLVCSLAINFAHGQIIADFTFDDDSDLPASLLHNRVGEDATGISDFAYSDGEGIYTLPDPDNPDGHPDINLEIPESFLNQTESVYMEFDFRNQESFAWLIYSGYVLDGDLFRIGHLENPDVPESNGLNVRYSTQQNPADIIESDFVAPMDRGERALIGFMYDIETGTAYLYKNEEIVWETPDAQKTPGQKLHWRTENGFHYIGANMNGDGSSIPSLYRFRVFDGLCPEIDQPEIVEEETTFEVCEGEEATLKVTGGMEGDYRWYESLEATTPIEEENNSRFTTPPIQESRSYFVALSDGGCESERKEIAVTMLERPSPPIEITEHQRCGPGEITLEVSGGTDGSYSWYESEDALTPIPGAVNSRFKIDHLEESKTYYVRVTGENCISQPTAIEASINPVPAKPEVQHSQPCAGEMVDINISNPLQGIEYLWFPAGDSRALHQGSSLSLQPGRDTLVYVRASNGICTSEAVQIELNIIEKPQIDAGADLTILKGESIDLQASGQYASLQWQPHETLQFPDSPTPRVSPAFTHTYLVTAINEQGCESKDSVTVHVLDKFPVPNAFSPNSDGKNDAWEIPNIENYPGASLKVFNRWGNEVFSSQGYASPWDGSHDGKPLPAGSYYFILQLSSETDPVKGTVLILR